MTSPPDRPAPEAPDPGTDGRTDVIPLRTALRAWFVISLQTFGGPAGQIAVMQRTLVEEKRWIGQRRFSHALNYCMLLPGPEAQQLAIYVGWLLNGVRGGLAAGVLFVLPGAAALFALSAVYVGFGTTTAVTALFAGLAPAVLAVVAQAVWRVGKRSLTHPALVALAAAAFLALAVFAVPFPIVVGAAGLAGWTLHRYAPRALDRPAPDGRDAEEPAPLIGDDTLHHVPPTARRTATVLGVGLALWAVPVVVLLVVTGPGSVFTAQGLFFSGTAVVTFGGAYAVLAYVAQRAVEVYGWLAPGEMVRGLALAETTPGPLIMVVQFVAFLGAYRNPGELNPWVAGTLGSLITLWVTFVPCFLFVFLGAPYIERLRANRALAAALSGVTAAVVGVIANLALYFALNTLFRTTRDLAWGPIGFAAPDPTTLRPVAVAITVAALVMVFALRWSVLRTLGACALLGLAAAVAALPLT